MNPFSYPAAAHEGSPANDLFAAASYMDWARAANRLDLPDESAFVFDSTICEPAGLLREAVLKTFLPQASDRFASVFDRGNPFVLAALARRYGVSPEQIVPATGAISAFAMAIKALVRPGDCVLAERPGFEVLAAKARESGAAVEYVDRPPPDFGVDLEALRTKLTPRTRLVLLTNLHNPSGAFLSPSQLRAIAAVAEETGALVLVDEVYADFARPALARPAAALAPNLISVSSLTKIFGLFALKCGWLIAAPEIVAQIQAAVPDGDLGISKLSHAVAAQVLENPAPFDRHWRAVLAAARPVVVRQAAKMVEAGLIEGEVPEFGCMYFPRVRGCTDTLSLARRIWEEFGVLVAPGEYFGRPGHIRIGFGGDARELERGLAKLRAGLEALGGSGGR